MSASGLDDFCDEGMFADRRDGVVPDWHKDSWCSEVSGASLHRFDSLLQTSNHRIGLLGPIQRRADGLDGMKNSCNAVGTYQKQWNPQPLQLAGYLHGTRGLHTDDEIGMKREDGLDRRSDQVTDARL